MQVIKNENLLDKRCIKKTIVKISNLSQSTNAVSATNFSGTY